MLPTIPFVLALFGASTAAPVPSLKSIANDISTIIGQGEDAINALIPQLEAVPKSSDPVQDLTNIARSLEGTVVQVVYEIGTDVSTEVAAAILGIENNLGPIATELSGFFQLVQNTTDNTVTLGEEFGADAITAFNSLLSAIDSADKYLQQLLKNVQSVTK